MFQILFRVMGTLVQWNLDLTFEPLFNEVLDKTNENLHVRPGQNYSKMYGIEPGYNEPRYSEFLDITNIMQKPKRKIYLDNYNKLQCQHATEDKR